jgi:asparagine synthase (glutamine-hydrolysing)
MPLARNAALGYHDDESHFRPANGAFMTVRNAAKTPIQLGNSGPPAQVADVTAAIRRRRCRKIRQRVRGGGRAQLGANEMAALVVAHWRAEPDALAPLRGNGIVRDAWLNELLSGAGTAPAGTVAFLANLFVATR